MTSRFLVAKFEFTFWAACRHCLENLACGTSQYHLHVCIGLKSFFWRASFKHHLRQSRPLFEIEGELSVVVAHCGWPFLAAFWQPSPKFVCGPWPIHPVVILLEWRRGQIHVVGAVCPTLARSYTITSGALKFLETRMAIQTQFKSSSKTVMTKKKIPSHRQVQL